METHGLTAAVLRLVRAAESPAEVVKPDYRAPRVSDSWAWGGAGEGAFLTSSPVLQGPHAHRQSPDA